MALLGLLTPTVAHAHFKLNAPASWMSQDSVGGPQKTGPCAAVANTSLGDSAGTPTNVVTALPSGQTVSVSVTATVAHPGWYRIALAEGASATQTLSTLADPRAQMGTNCTPAIMSNPVWSSTQPVIADGLPAGSTASTQQSGNQTFQVTLPKGVSCPSTQPCSLQVIMVMTDHPASDCYYHHCADISIGSTTDGGGGAVGTDASVAKDAPTTARDASGAMASGGSGGGMGGAAGNGSGGGTAAGGSTDAGGVFGRGGSSGVGGVTGSGGSAGEGGSIVSGGATGTGGIAGAGGLTGSGASAGSGGGASSGGVTEKGGNTAGGGLTGSGGSSSAGVGGMTGTGAGGRSGASTSSGSASGCDLSPSRRGSFWSMIAVAMFGAWVALRGRALRGRPRRH